MLGVAKAASSICIAVNMSVSGGLRHVIRHSQVEKSHICAGCFYRAFSARRDGVSGEDWSLFGGGKIENSLLQGSGGKKKMGGGLETKHRKASGELKNEQKGDLVCASCGVELQDTDPDGAGYYKKRRMDKNSRILDYLASAKEKMVQEREKIVLGKFEKLEAGIQLKPKMDDTVDRRVFCERCLGIMHRAEYDLKPRTLISVQEVMKSIPADANVVNVVSALDFPLGLSRAVNKGRDPSKLWYIVTKADAFYSEKVQLERLGIKYFRDSISSLVGADPNHVFLVSGKLGWSTEMLLEKLPGGKMYFVGRTNSGKSTLVRTLIYRDDRTLNSASHYGPGISSIPGLTVGHLKYKMKHRGDILVDTPGFWPQGGGVYKYMLKERIRELSKVATYASAYGNRWKTRTPRILGKKMFNGARVYTIGGFFYLKPPVGAVIRVFTGIRGPEAAFRNITRAKVVSSNRNSTNEDDYFVNKKAALNLVRYVIPPFYGSIDVVLRDVGYFMITPCGKFGNDDVYEVYVPKGVEVVVRESIFKYLYKTRSSRDETGNLLSKRNMPRRGVPVLRKVPSHKLIFTSLYRVPKEMPHMEAAMTVVPNYEFMEHFDTQNTEATYPNTYWKMPKLD